MQITNNKIQLESSSLKELASGGEGTVHEYKSDRVIKLYHTPRKKEFAKHLQALSILGNRFVKPEDIWYTISGEVAGFEMKFVDFNKNTIFYNLTSKAFCLDNDMDFKFKIQVLKNLRAAVEECHNNDIVIGDLNQYNFFVTSQADIIYVDVDSFSTKDKPPSNVILEDINDWTTTAINKLTDIWAYTILSFWILTYMHPFKFGCKTNSDGLQTRVRKGLSILSGIKDTIFPTVYNKLPDALEDQFRNIFKGRRFFIDFDGITMQANAIIKAVNIMSQALNIKEIATGVRSINATQCYIALNFGARSMILNTCNKGTVIERLNVTCNAMYPANNGNYAYLDGDYLYDMKGTKYPIRPVVSYLNGSLMTVDYDTAECFDISQQIAGIYKSHTPVFGRSFLKYDSLIQNMSGKKFLVQPIKAGMNLIEIDMACKNIYTSGDYSIQEIMKNGKVTYLLMKHTERKIYSMDYYAHFACKGDVIFYPDDKQINVIKDGTIITSLDCNVCTRDSKLYQTNSGIILLESGTVYLLNTK